MICLIKTRRIPGASRREAPVRLKNGLFEREAFVIFLCSSFLLLFAISSSYECKKNTKAELFQVSDTLAGSVLIVE